MVQTEFKLSSADPKSALISHYLPRRKLYMTYFGDISIGEKKKLNVTAQRGNAWCLEMSGCFSSRGSGSWRVGVRSVSGTIFRPLLGHLPKREGN